MRALITGSAGFVGRHFTRALMDRSVHVTPVDVRFGIDCLDVFASDDRFDLVVHCAANVGGRANIDGDPLGVAHNLALDEALFRWAVRTGTRVLYFSSSAAYPVHLQQPHEGGWHRLMRLAEAYHYDLAAGLLNGSPDNTYGLAKRVGEQLADLARAEGVPVHVVRPFSGYGTDQDLTYPFPSFIDRARRREDPFTVWGDGTQTRDFIHIDDVVAACLAIIDADCQVPVNLCTGVPTSFLELADLVTAEAGYTPEVVTHPDRPTGVHWRVGDPTLMRQFWTPRVSLAAGVRRALEEAPQHAR